MAAPTHEAVLAAFNKYLSDNAGGHSIDWPGMELDTTALTEWLIPRILARTPSPSRTAEDVGAYTAQVNVCVKFGADAYRAWEIAGNIAQLFEHKEITQGTVIMKTGEVNQNLIPASAGIREAALDLVVVNVSFTFTVEAF